MGDRMFGMSGMFGGIVAATVVALVAPAVYADGVVMKPAFRQGQTFAYALSMETRIEHSQNEEKPVQSFLQARATIDFAITDVGADGSLQGTLAVRSMWLNAPEGEVEATYEWPLPAKLPDDAPAEKKLGGILGAAQVRFAVAADRSVAIIGGLEPFVAAVNELKRPDDRLMGFFAPDKLAAAISPIFSIDGAGDAGRLAGQGWQTSETILLPPAAAFELTSDWSVEQTDATAAIYNGRTSVELRRPEQQGNTVLVSLGESDGLTTATWDRSLGMLVQRKSNLILRTQWSLEGASLNQTQSSTQFLKFLKNE